MKKNFENISHSTIVDESAIVDSFNATQQAFDAKTREALLKLAQIVENSDNCEAIELWNEFNVQLSKPEKKKPILKSLWNGLTSAIPTIHQSAEVVETIANLIK